MRVLGVFSFAAVLAMASPAFADEASAPANPLFAFLKAADKNDFVTMQPLLAPRLMLANVTAISPSDFIAKVTGCYLRRVYDDDIAKRLIAAWMCDEGPGKSRLVLARLGTADGKVQLVIDREDHNNRPAPPRTGPALGEEGAK